MARKNDPVSAKLVAICSGCGRTDKQTGEYDKNNPVEEDGTYADGKFVCTSCYVRLIPIGRDIGSPAEVQAAIKELIASQKKS